MTSCKLHHYDSISPEVESCIAQLILNGDLVTETNCHFRLVLFIIKTKESAESEVMLWKRKLLLATFSALYDHFYQLLLITK